MGMYYLKKKKIPGFDWGGCLFQPTVVNIYPENQEKYVVRR